MQKKQLAILRSHGELWSVQDYRDYLSAKYKKDKKSPFGVKENHLFKGTHLKDSPLSIKFFEERYTVDQKVFKVLEESIESFLHPLSGFSGPGVEEKVSKRIKLYPAIKEIKVKMLCKEMTKLTGDYEELVREKLCLLSTPINEQELISTWYFYLTNQDFEKLIELLKFDIFKGERIESFGHPFIREAPKNTDLLDGFFYKCDKLCLLREATSMLENILYLKEHINDLKNQNEEVDTKGITSEKTNSKNKLFKYKETAIAYRFLEIDIDESKASGILKKHSQQRSITELIKAKYENTTASLIKLRETKTANTKHLESLRGAKRIIISMKNKKAQDGIERVITAFELNYKNKY